MEPAESLGQRVRRLRQENGLSQAQVATADASASYVSLIEAGKREPTRSALEGIAAKLRTTTEYLLTGKLPESARETALEISYAELVLRNGDATEALRRFASVRSKLGPTDRPAWRRATWGLARSHENLGQPSTAIRLLDELRNTADPEDTDPSRVKVDVAAARCHRQAGDLNAAIRLAEATLESYDALGNPGGPEELDLAATLVECYVASGDWDRAAAFADDTIRRADQTGSAQARAAANWAASTIANGRGDLGLALELSERALALMSEGDSSRDQAAVKIHRAWLLLNQAPGNADRALALLRPVEQELEETGDVLPLAYCRLEKARALLFAGDLTEADTLADLAFQVFKDAGDEPQAVSALVVRAQASALLGRADDARASLRAATDALERLPRQRSLASQWLQIAREHEALGDADETTAAYRAGLAAAGVVAPPRPDASPDRPGAHPRVGQGSRA